VKVPSAALLIVLVAAAATFSQYVPGGSVAPSYGGGYGYGWGGHASTAAEGYQRGYADVVRSYGMANLLNSEASKNWEDARRAYIDNRAKATETYFEMRRYNNEARKAERGSPFSMETFVRLSHQQAPARLSTSQLDPLTGGIGWPAALQKNEYTAFRTRLDGLFKNLAAGYSDSGEIKKAVEEFQEQLKADLAQFQANDYLAAKNFLTSLSQAGRAAL